MTRLSSSLSSSSSSFHRALTLLSPPLFSTLYCKRHIVIPLSHGSGDGGSSNDKVNGGECTLYIKGFLAKGENADHFGDWLRYVNIFFIYLYLYIYFYLLYFYIFIFLYFYLFI